MLYALMLKTLSLSSLSEKLFERSWLLMKVDLVTYMTLKLPVTSFKSS